MGIVQVNGTATATGAVAARDHLSSTAAAGQGGGSARDLSHRSHHNLTKGIGDEIFEEENGFGGKQAAEDIFMVDRHCFTWAKIAGNFEGETVVKRTTDTRCKVPLSPEHFTIVLGDGPKKTSKYNAVQSPPIHTKPLGASQQSAWKEGASTRGFIYGRFPNYFGGSPTTLFPRTDSFFHHVSSAGFSRLGSNSLHSYWLSKDGQAVPSGTAHAIGRVGRPYSVYSASGMLVYLVNSPPCLNKFQVPWVCPKVQSLSPPYNCSANVPWVCLVNSPPRLNKGQAPWVCLVNNGQAGSHELAHAVVIVQDKCLGVCSVGSGAREPSKNKKKGRKKLRKNRKKSLADADL